MARPRPTVEYLVAALGLAFVCAIALFPVRNNDIWWHMAVGRELLDTKRFIDADPFTFTVTGASWVPHSWLADVFFYLVHAVTSAAGLIAVRALVVVLIFLVSYRLLRRLGISVLLATPVMLVVALCAHSRFIVRPHLFEYLFVVIVLGHLLFHRNASGIRFYAVPVAVQVVWVNVHASFLLGPLMVALFYTGEGLSQVLSKRLRWIRALDRKAIEWKRVGALFGLMVVACFINPSPAAFVLQPFGAEQRELMSRFTLEWRSPFDPALRGGAFHPYYEMILAVTVIAFAAGVTRLRLASLVLVGFFAGLSLTAHRFRVEYALVALPLALDQLHHSQIAGRARRAFGRRGTAVLAVLAVAAAVALVYTARDRIMVDGAVAARYPAKAFEFIRAQDVAERPFHTIAYGSYLLWDLYPERRSFIDGRNFDAGLHRDFIACQANADGFNAVTGKYDLDAFIIPAPERSDAGMQRVHGFLTQSTVWTLAHIDGFAYVYVHKEKVPPAFFDAHAYRWYHPATFGRLRFSAGQAAALVAEVERAVSADTTYVRPLLHLAFLYETVRDTVMAVQTIERVLPRVPDPLPYLDRLCRLYAGQHKWEPMIRHARSISLIDDDDYRGDFFEAWAYMEAGNYVGAMGKAERAVEKDPQAVEARLMLAQVYIAGVQYDHARDELEAALSIDPENRDALAIKRYLDSLKE